MRAVTWNERPALNTVLYRFSEEEVRYILVYGRQFSPMSPWGIAGGGPMNDQQIDSEVHRVPEVDPAAAEQCPSGVNLCEGGTLPKQKQDETEGHRRRAGGRERQERGQATFNRPSTPGSGLQCARCRTNWLVLRQPAGVGRRRPRAET